MEFVLNHGQKLLKRAVPPPVDLVVIQGSPRAHGNCSILAGWAVEAAQDLGRRHASFIRMTWMSTHA